MRTTTRTLAIPAVLLLAAGLAACGGEVPVAGGDSPTAAVQETPGAGNPSGAPTSGAPSAGTGDGGSRSVPASDLQVGDCFNFDASDEVSTVDVVSRDSPHLFEVFNNADIDGSTYTTVPDGDALNAEIRTACYDAFTSYVGIPYNDSSYQFRSFQPSASSWAQGDRTITCLITSEDGQPLTGSARNTRK